MKEILVIIWRVREKVVTLRENKIEEDMKEWIKEFIENRDEPLMQLLSCIKSACLQGIYI